MLANLVNIVPFCLSIEAIRIIFRAFNGGGQSLDTTRLWCIFGCMTGYIAVMVLAERAAYRANFRGAYEMSASGRISLAEHLRKLSLGFLCKRDPGDLSSMLITDFTMAETGISHYLPQLMGALVMPVLAFVSLLWIDWRMAVAMFVALPFAMGIILLLGAIVKIQSSINMKRLRFAKWYLVLICAILIGALGVVLLCNPFQKEEDMILYIGICLILDGLTNLTSLICIQVRVKQLNRLQTEYPQADVSDLLEQKEKAKAQKQQPVVYEMEPEDKDRSNE